ncbi:transporter substrate-binding domain-containing protein [Phaeocystidibacter luteus]|uniref:Transporter substrate-binding domain-containing protein n=2 Tax=Phaeocystidibacter luteus TaxID=911197 RepID=A0A6N6RM99_9FLAO|nr:transporter substrate-binding domain-containing protein [Phaeocystidibacter luteus]
MMQKTSLPYLIVISAIATISFWGCTEKPSDDAVVLADNSGDSIQQPLTQVPGTLTVLMDNNMASYYIMKGQPRGFDYDILTWYCKDHGLSLDVKIIPDFDYILDSLLAGNGDLAAGNLTITGERLRRVQFSSPLHYTRQVLVQRLTPEARRSRAARKEWLVDHILELEGRQVHVNRTTSFAERLYNIIRENGIQVEVVEVASDVGYSRLIEMVAEEEIDLTVADENIARMHKAFYPNLDINTPISLTQAIAWAVPPGNDTLLTSLNTWLESKVNSSKYNIIYNRYFSNNPRRNESIREIRNGRISAFDKMIQSEAEKMGWDWRMLAALIHQESRFNPDAQSPFGATGLMQVMPNTGKRFGVEPHELKTPSRNLEAGTGFLLWLEKYWRRKMTDTTDIKKFILASYNVGLGHVIDARNLAEKYELETDVWYDNVEVMLENKMLPKYYNDPVVEHGYCRGKEPVNYVRGILRTYNYYVEFTDNNQAIEEIAGISLRPPQILPPHEAILEGEVNKGL